MINIIVFGPLMTVLLLFTFNLSKKTIGTVINFVSIFNFMWLGLSIISLWSFYGLYQPSTMTYIIVIFTSIIYTVVSLGVYTGIFHAHRENAFPDNNVVMALPRSKLLVLEFLTLFAIAWMSQYVVKMFPMIAVGDWSYARLHYLQSNVYTGIYNTRSILWNQWIIYPIINVATIVSAYYVAQMKPKYVLLIISSIGQIMVVISTAGRSALFKTVVFYVVAYVLLSRRQFGLLQRIRQSSKPVKTAIVLGLLGLIYITTQRRIGDSSVMENILIYFIGPFIYLSNIISNPLQFGLTQDYLLGRATFGVITTPIEIMASLLFGYDYAGADNIITSYINTYLSLSDTAKGNAVSTMLYPFMKDFSVYGFWIGVVLFAVVTTVCFAKAKTSKHNYVFWNSMSIFMLYAVFFSEWQYELLFPASFTTMLLLYVFISSKRIRIMLGK